MFDDITILFTNNLASYIINDAHKHCVMTYSIQPNKHKVRLKKIYPWKNVNESVLISVHKNFVCVEQLKLIHILKNQNIFIYMHKTNHVSHIF